jgi:hypothetical protein
VSANVINLAAAIEKREQRHWDAAARTQGFRDYAELHEAYEKEFDAQFEWLQKNCDHADKHPGLGMCEECAGRLQV